MALRGAGRFRRWWRAFEEQFFGPARAAYGEERWNKAEAEGARLNFEQAIALALSPDHSQSSG